MANTAFVPRTLVLMTHCYKNCPYNEYLLYIAGRGTAKFSRQDMFKADGGVGIEMTDRVFKLAPCHDIPWGLGMLQNLPSAIVAHVLNPSPGATVLDMCASPGGKALCRFWEQSITNLKDSRQSSTQPHCVLHLLSASVTNVLIPLTGRLSTMYS